MKKTFFVGLALSVLMLPLAAMAQDGQGYAISRPFQVLSGTPSTGVQRTAPVQAPRASTTPALTQVGGRLYFAGTPTPSGGVVPESSQPVTYHEPVYVFYSGAAVPLPSPRWEEFCPKDFLTLPASSGGSSESILASAGGIRGGGFTKRSTREKMNTYWSMRRSEFEQGLAQCQSTPGAEGDCYLNLRKHQEEKNDAYRRALLKTPQSILIPFARCSSNGAGGYFCY